MSEPGTGTNKTQCNLPWCKLNRIIRRDTGPPQNDDANNVNGNGYSPSLGWSCTGKLFECITKAYGKGCFNHPFHPLYIIDTLCEVTQGAPNLKESLIYMVEQGLAFIKTATENQEMYEVAEVLFIMASVCFQCDKNLEVCHLIAKIIRAQMDLVTAVTQSGAPWTRQLSISRWFAFLSSAPEDRHRLNHLYPCHKAVNESDTEINKKALSYYLTGAHDVIFKLPFKIDKSNPSHDNQLFTEMDVPAGFGLRDIQMYDFPIRKASDNATFTPLGLACRSVSPTVVLVLLQHGASSLLYKDALTETPLGLLVEPLGILLRLLNRSWTWRSWTNPEIQNCVLESLRQNEAAMEQAMVKCLVIMLRSFTNAPINFYDDDDKELLSKSNGYKIGDNGKVSFFLHSRYENLVPKSRINCPPELQHICRIFFRKHLLKLKLLPRAIDQLPLTCVLYPYMKLLC